jgi:hypothetical protein
MSLHRRPIDNIYYNIRVNGNSDNTLASCMFTEQRTIPIVDNPSEYYFSVIRYNIPTSTIPLLIVPVRDNDPTKTVYSVSLSYNGFSSAQTFIRWAPTLTQSSSELLALPKLTIPTSKAYANAEDGYYYCNSYTYFTNLVNKAFQSAFSDLSGKTVLPVGAVAPYYTYDSKSKLFSLVAPASVYDVNKVATPIKIFMNNDLWNLYGAVSCQIYLNPTFIGNDRQILMTSDVSNVDASGNIQFLQEYVSICQWCAMKSIVITTNTIPIVSEGIPAVNNSYTPANSQVGSSAYLPIISSYDALVSTAGYEDFQSVIQFTPTGPYKLIDLIGTNPLSNFDVQVYWQDTYGGLHQLFLLPFESCTMTFVFIRKGSYINN